MAPNRRALPLALVALVVCAAPASASELVSVPRARDGSCVAHLRSGPGVVHRPYTARAAGYLSARLRAASGDWDLAAFRRSGGEPVAASAYRGSIEVAEGFVRRGDKLVVQACRRSGRSDAARLSIRLTKVDTAKKPPKLSLVKVSTPTRARKAQLLRLGLDVTEDGGPNYIVVLLHGPRDAAKLRRANFVYQTQIGDLGAVARRDRRAEATAAAVSGLPSGRTATYRRLADYGAEMKALAAANPGIVRTFTLPHLSIQGRPVEGLVITTDQNARLGKPVFLQLGMHHAREWPAAEYPLEWAYELVNGYNAGDPRTVALVRNVRTIIVPVVNPDGFNVSREAGQAYGHGGGYQGFGSLDEFHRKNCRLTTSPGTCAQQATNNQQPGVDPNRNYGYRWGGIGGSSSTTDETYFGTGPFSEPETQNIRELISSEQVTVMITNHTVSAVVMRQPGVNDGSPTPDEPAYGALGAAMAAQNGYTNEYAYQLYDHVGTTDNWSYYTTAGFHYVIEAGGTYFHPLYANMVKEYDGTASGAGGNREAYYIAAEATANPALHSRIAGNAPPGAVLRLAKDVSTPTTIGPAITDRLSSTLDVPASGRFEWHVNPSSRPLVPGETWTLTCEQPAGTVLKTQQVSVARGQAVEVDACPAARPPTPDVDILEKPGVGAKVRATFNGRFYRVRVAGSLSDVANRAKVNPGDAGPGSERCAGNVTITLRAKRKKVVSRKTAVDADCAYERSFKFGRRKLPKSLRRKGARIRLQAITRWPGNSFLQPAERRVTVKVKRR